MVDETTQKRLSAPLSERRAVLGEEHVDRALADDSPGMHEFQEYITEFAWGVWARGVLNRRERSILALGIVGALGRMEEFLLHLRGARRNGLSNEELNELVIQLVAYAGTPAGVAARRALTRFLDEEDTAG